MRSKITLENGSETSPLVKVKSTMTYFSPVVLLVLQVKVRSLATTEDDVMIALPEAMAEPEILNTVLPPSALVKVIELAEQESSEMELRKRKLI